MDRYFPIPRAVLLEFQSLRIVSLVLAGGVVSSLTLFASEIDDDADIAAAFLCHFFAPLNRCARERTE